MDSRNVIFAIILSSIVLIVWATFFEAPIVDQNIEENQITKNQETDSPSIDEDKKEQITEIARSDVINNTDRINLLEFRNGYYLIQIEDDNRIERHKLIKN